MAEPAAGPTGPGAVVLDIGAGTGALVLHTPAALAGREIEISAAGAPGSPRTHSLVRERRTPRGVTHAAVYPGLPAGDYIIWRGPATPGGTVTIAGGQVTSHRWDVTRAGA
ncbi:MAG: hypothetical protein JOY82_15795 [Streptosporangiaceae bacterium]|nr:hypothetical protein [Streptosporangiaceae bacterium]MBV9855954.1 hypothetical protein [Streptosporangiaceae bacterium]